MGFLSDLAEDVFETAEKVVRSPARIICVHGHDWHWHSVSGNKNKYKCSMCGATTKADKRPDE